MRRILAAVAILALLGVGVSFLMGRAGFAPFGRARTHLLLISLDTVRADALGSYGYAKAQTPRLDALAAQGLRFEQATTVAPLTLPAHSSLLTGTFPASHGVRDNGGFYLGDEQVTLAEVLRGEGYRTGAFVGAFVLDSRWGTNQGFDRYFDEFDLSEMKGGGMASVQRKGDEVIAEALRWLGEESDAPFFGWVHLYDPHTPYEAPEPYRSRFPRTRSGAYDAEIAWTDELVGRLLDGLAELGHLEDTLVVVLGDHGEALGEHKELDHGFFIYDEVVQIPLMIAGPGVPSRVVPDQVRIVDVMPTALELLHVEAPASVQGTSLVPLSRGEELELLALSETWYPKYHYGWSELTAVRNGRYKFIQAPRRELYDLVEDPGELENLAAENSHRADALERALGELLEQVTSEAASRGPSTMDPETEERLQALGYLGGSISARNLEDRPRGDPKDKIGLFNLLRKASQDALEERIDEAIAKVQEALAEDPEIVEAYTLLARFHRKGRSSRGGDQGTPAGLGARPRASWRHLQPGTRPQERGAAGGRGDRLRAGPSARSQGRQAVLELGGHPHAPGTLRRGREDSEGRPGAGCRPAEVPLEAGRVLHRVGAVRRRREGHLEGPLGEARATPGPLQPGSRPRGPRPDRASHGRVRSGDRSDAQGLQGRLQPGQAADDERPPRGGSDSTP